MNRIQYVLLTIFSGIYLSGCGGSGGSSSSSPLPAAPVATISYSSKQVILNWTPTSGANYYTISKDLTGSAGYSQIASVTTGTVSYIDVYSKLTDFVNATYKVSACNTSGCTDSATLSGFTSQAIGYLKASNTGASDAFGVSVALSSDGSTLAVGTPGESSNATGINGHQADNSAATSGAVYVFTHIGNQWTQQAYIKASNTEAGDSFGARVALSNDGSTLAVRAASEDSNATGINGTQADNSASNSGAVYVYTRSGTTWTQQAYIKASNTGTSDNFGAEVAISGDGNTLAVGAPAEDSNATGVNGNQADNSSITSGAVYVFTRSGGLWTQQAYIKASNTEASDQFGVSLTLSSDGNTLAIGANGEDSNSTGVNGNQADNSASGSGAVYIFTRSSSLWTQQAYIKASNTEASDDFGIGLTLSSDGNTLAVGAKGEDSNSTGVNGNQADNSASGSGAVYVFTRTSSLWTQQAYIKASNTDASDVFGDSLSLSSDGNILAIGGAGEDSSATGINGSQLDNGSLGTGAVYLFTRNGGVWSQQAYIKASNTGAGDSFSSNPTGLALSGDGSALAVGAWQEDSNATGINGNQADNTASNSGAVYVY